MRRFSSLANGNLYALAGMAVRAKFIRHESASRAFSGGCHCGRLGVTFSAALDMAAFIPRACGCGFCRKHGATYLSDPRGRLTLQTSGSAGDIYRFGLGITDFHVCGACGVLVAATWSDRAGNIFGVVNLRALDGTNGLTTAPANLDFDEENVAQRQARRTANWTPTLVLTNGS